MSSVNGYIKKALWFIERHTKNAIDLDVISKACGVSKYHLSRSFSSKTGLSLIQYLRKRRLTIAANELNKGSKDILTIALESGYNSHEAFTRAFVKEFNLTPEKYRLLISTKSFHTQKTLSFLGEYRTMNLKPRIEEHGPFQFAGLKDKYLENELGVIPGLWQSFSPYIKELKGVYDSNAYGISYKHNGNSTYMCALNFRDLSQIPKNFSILNIRKQLYAIFTHKEHIADIKDTYLYIWNEWLSSSKFICDETSPRFECYPSLFDDFSGFGDVEIWIPIKPR